MVALLFTAAITACTSTWDRHREAMRTHAASGQWPEATTEARWLVDNAFMQAPLEQRTAAAEADRQLDLAHFAARAGDVGTAAQALRDALAADPSQASAVRGEIEAMPLSPADAQRIAEEFAWNATALAPTEVTGDLRAPADAECWSYRVQEVRVRRHRTVRGADGMERQLTYDARPWVFDAGTQRWTPDGGWIADSGTEIELVQGPQRPRYRALSDTTHTFYADRGVPPCHRRAWRGPFAADGTVFVATHLPES